MMNVFTIGYEGLSLDQFISLLKKHDIETIIDVRELPLSRKHGFSKNALANTLNLSGCEYVHIASLGCPKPVRNRYREDGDWDRYTEGFMKHLTTQDDAIQVVSGMVISSNCALLCYEADYNFCHRSMVAKAIQEYCNVGIRHIQSNSIKTRTVEYH